jgi:hypothetical protein
VFSRSRGRTRSCGGWARERPLFVFMGFQLPAFFIESFYQNWPAVGLKESLLICRDWVLPVGRPISITAGAGWPRGISKPSTRQA